MCKITFKDGASVRLHEDDMTVELLEMSEYDSDFNEGMLLGDPVATLSKKLGVDLL